MAAITIPVRTSDDGTVTIPRDAARDLGLSPGDVAEVRLEIANGVGGLAGDAYSEALASVLEAIDDAVPAPGRALADPVEAEWGRGVEEKARRLGLRV